MIENPKYSRRDFLAMTVIGGGALTLAGGSLGVLEGCTAGGQPAHNFLSDREYRLVEAIAEQIIPTDEWPGGRDAGVANYIDTQLIGPYTRFQEDYRRGLGALEEHCTSTHRAAFEELPWETQTSVLRAMETGAIEGDQWKDGFSKRFFELVRSHALQGYYGSPRHGGNKNFVSFAMMGIDDIQTIGQNRYGA